MHLDYLSSIQFADDTTLYHGCRHLKYSKFCIESDLAVIEDWFAANKLTLNVGKTVLMLFKPKTKRANQNKENIKLNISLNGEKIPCKTHTKFLGLLIDENLNWEQHVANLLLRIRSRLGLLRKGKNLLTKHTKKILYYAQMHSLFQYGIVIWGPLIPSPKLKKLQKLQNKCVQLIDPRNCIDKIYREHKIPKISEMITLECCKLWQRHSLGLLPTKLESLMSRDN